MRMRLLTVFMLTLLLAACANDEMAQQEPRQQPAANGEKPASAKEKATAEKEPSAKESPAKEPPVAPVKGVRVVFDRKAPGTPDYHFPAGFPPSLDIQIEAPPVPDEIKGPSPPIQGDKKDTKGSEKKP
jgi:hypothetical protein